MTIKELFIWAENNNCLDCDICVRNRYDGGLYFGTDYDIHPTLERTAHKNLPESEICKRKNVIVL